MRTQNFHDRSSEVDLVPRRLLAFLLATGLMTGAYAFIHYAAEVDANSGRMAVRVVEHP